MTAIFPVVRTIEQAPLEEVAGTGFFVAGHLFVTCAHIIEADPTAQYKAAINPSDLRQLREIEWVRIAHDFDIALGRVLHAEDHPELAFSQRDLAIGERTAIRGFAGGLYREQDGTYIRTVAEAASIEGPCVRRIPIYNIPHIPPYAPKSFPAIVTRPAGVGGMSGSPLLDEDGSVVGVYSNNSPDPNITLLGDPVAVSVAAVVPAGMLIAPLQMKVRALEEAAAAARGDLQPSEDASLCGTARKNTINISMS